jgi:hypothetical protein
MSGVLRLLSGLLRLIFLGVGLVVMASILMVGVGALARLLGRQARDGVNLDSELKPNQPDHEVLEVAAKEVLTGGEKGQKLP